MNSGYDTPLHRQSLSKLAQGVREYAIFTIALDGTIGSWNEGVRKLLGYDEHDFIGMDSAVLFSDEDRAAGFPRREFQEALDRGEAQDDRWHVKRSGELCWVNGILTTIHDDHGDPYGFVKIMRDQSAFKKAHDMLRESQERFAKAFHSSPSPAAILRLPAGEITELNDAFADSFGSSYDALIGRPLQHLVPDGDVAKRILAELRDGRPVHQEAIFRRHVDDHGAGSDAGRAKVRHRRTADGDDGEDGSGHGSFAFEPVEIGGQPRAVMLMHDVSGYHDAREQIEREAAILEGILASLPGVFYMLDGSKRYRLVRWNEDLERVTGYDAEELATMRAVDLVVEEDLAGAGLDAWNRRPRASVEARLRCKDGTLVPYLFTVHGTVLPDGPYVVGIGVNIADQREAREAIRRRAHRQESIAQLAASLLEATTEVREAIDRSIDVVTETLGPGHAHVLRMDERGGLAVVGASDAGIAARRADELALDDRGRVRDTTGRRGVRALIRTPDGPYGLIEALRDPASDTDDEEDARFLGTIATLLGSAIERQRLHQSLAHEAEHDQLTGLPNRLVIEVRLENAIERAERVDGKVAVALLDLDRFKHVNDSLGHAAGDELLASVAERLTDSVRGMDTVARLGGDEFVVLVPEIADEAEAGHVAERILAAFEPPFSAAGRELTVRATLGVALYPDDGRTVDALLRAADRAMYLGKTAGHGSFRFATAAHDTGVAERLELERDLQDALATDQLELAFQPQMDLATDRPAVVEALVRWRHPVRGVLPPAAFLPLAQEVGLVARVDDWAIRAACRAYHTFGDAQAGSLRLAVNVAPRHLVQPSFPERMEALARDEGVPPDRIEIEIHEAAVLHDPDLVTTHLRKLVALGFRITLDDFGTGHAALALVRSLPFGRLKIDEVHVHALAGDDPEAAAFAEILIRMGTSLGLDVVAEGVETAGQRRAVERHGCNYAQGRLIADALSGEELVAFLRSTT